MKILLVNNLYPPRRVGGAERSVQLLAEGLQNAGHESVVVALKPGGSPNRETRNGVLVHRLPIRNRYWPFDNVERSRWQHLLWYFHDAYNRSAARDVRKLIRKETPDLVHTHNLLGFSPLVWRTVKKQGLPLVHTLRDYYLLCRRSTMFTDGERCGSSCPECRVLKSTGRWISDCVDAYVGISKYILQSHREAGLITDSHRTSVIRNPVENTGSDKTSNETGDERLTLGYLGQIEPNKGLGWLLGELQNVSEKSWRLRIGGEDTTSFARRLKNTYERDSIEYLGFVDPNSFFAGIDLLVVPSLWEEPMGRVVIESYAHGVPVLASRRGGLSEIVDDGRTGYLYNPDDPRTFHKCLDLALEGDFPEIELGENGRPDRFKPETITRQHQEFYRDLLTKEDR